MTFVLSVGQVGGPSVRLVEPDQVEGGQAGNGVSGLQLLNPSFPPLPSGMPRPVGHSSGFICKVRCSGRKEGGSNDDTMVTPGRTAVTVY